MTRHGLDTEGYIEICCSIEKIAPMFRPAVDGSVALLKSTFQSKLHSIYLYGSIATGQAAPKQSDVDILVIFTDSISKQDHLKIKHVAQGLSASYQSLVREVGIGVVSIEEVLAEKTLPGIGCFIKHLCVCVDGEDIRPRLPRFRPSIEVARGFNGDYAEVIQAKLDELEKANQIEVAHPLMRQICRKTVRTGFSLVMPRLGCWTTDLKSSVDYFSDCYPGKRASMVRILNWVEHPPEGRSEFLQTIKPFAEGLIAEFDRVISK